MDTGEKTMERFIEYKMHEIKKLGDPRFDDWLNLYQTSFPLNEQMLCSTFIRLLRHGQGTNRLFVAEHDDKVVAMVHYELISIGETWNALALWYFAVLPEFRDRHLGTRLYSDWLIPTALHEHCHCIVFEVEKPEIAAKRSHEDGVLAQRRLGFYQRSGAKLVQGVHYIQSVGDWQPKTEMLLMIHPLKSIGELETFNIMRGIFGRNVRKVTPV